MKQALFVVGLGVLILAVGWWYASSLNEETAINPVIATTQKKAVSPADEALTEEQGASLSPENAAEFICAGGKKITAVFKRDLAALTLSDGRQFELRQTESASGAKYADDYRGIVFWGKDDTAVLEERGLVTYSNCEIRR